MEEKRQQGVPQLAGGGQVARIQRQAQPFRGEIRQMELDIAPPGAVIVPEMMVGVAATAAGHRVDVLFHACSGSEPHASGSGKQKCRRNKTTASVFRGDSFEDMGSSHIRRSLN